MCSLKPIVYLNINFFNVYLLKNFKYLNASKLEKEKYCIGKFDLNNFAFFL